MLFRSQLTGLAAGDGESRVEIGWHVERAWEFADSICLMPPDSSLTADKVMAYGMRIAEVFYRT